MRCQTHRKLPRLAPLFIFALLAHFAVPSARAAPEAGIYSINFWEIAGEPGKTTWVEIHNGDEARTTGVAHVSIIARKNGAPVWQIEWVSAHIAITTEALKRSVIRPLKTRPVYPEHFFEAYDRWKEDQKKGTAVVCSTSIQDFLRQHRQPPEGSGGAAKPPGFRDYPATNIFKGKPAKVDISSDPQARMFRTQLRRQAADGPNFAGRYKIAIWGCGTSCAQFAIVDCRTGRVYFPPELPFVTMGRWEGDDAGLQFRLDSRLLVVNGTRQEKEEVGTFYYVWRANKLKLIRSELKEWPTR